MEQTPDPNLESAGSSSSEEQRSAEEQRITAIIVQCSASIPTRIIAQLCKLDSLTITRRRTLLGITIGLAAAKRITSSFLAKLPELSELPLDLAQRREVALLRQHWLMARKGDIDVIERQEEIVARLSRLLPTAAISAILDISDTKVNDLKRALEVEVARAEHTRLRHAFAAEPVCPGVAFITKSESGRLQAAWRIAHDKKQAAKKKSAEKSAKVAEALLIRMRDDRARNVELTRPALESKCSGTCGECWPRSKAFFIPNFRSVDGLGNRCLYCTFLTRIDARASGRWGKRKKRGVQLTAEARERIQAVFKEYLALVPFGLLRRLFRLSEPSADRIRRETAVTLTRVEQKRIFWNWFFQPTTRELLLLSETELARLFMLTRDWHSRIAKRFEPDQEHAVFLNAERVRILASLWKGPGTQRPAERVCRCCNTEYPLQLLFFKRDRQWLSTACRVCDNYRQQQRRLKKLKRKFG